MVSLLARSDDPRVTTLILFVSAVLLLAPAAAWTMLGEITTYNRNTDRWNLISRAQNPLLFLLVLVAMYGLGTLMLGASVMFYALYF